MKFQASQCHWCDLMFVCGGMSMQFITCVVCDGKSLEIILVGAAAAKY